MNANRGIYGIVSNVYNMSSFNISSTILDIVEQKLLKRKIKMVYSNLSCTLKSDFI